MRRIGLFILIWFLMTTVAAAQDNQIRQVIDNQIAAFKANDFATAFSFASPSLRRQFQTPDNFRRMVIQGYPMVWRPAKVQHLGTRNSNGQRWHRIEIADQHGRLYLLDYLMRATDEGWRIHGVYLLDRPAPGA